MKMLILTTLLLTQTVVPPPSPVGAASIEGTVMGMDGPLADAEVTAFWDPPPVRLEGGSAPRTYTDANGKFVITLPSGTYRISAFAPGYVRQEFGAVLAGLDGSRTGTVFTLNSGDRISNVAVRLTSEGILAGRVLSTNGQPLVRMDVVALKRRFTAYGTSQLDVLGRAETNDRGEYRIAGLRPGAHYVVASSLEPVRLELERRRAAVTGIEAPPTPTPGFFPPVFYPRADDSSRASVVQILAGTEVRNIDFVLSKGQTYSIRGRVIDSASGVLAERAPMLGVSIAYYEYLAGGGASIEPYRPDGSFELQGVAPGKYWVTAQWPVVLTQEQRQMLSTPGADTSQLPVPVRGIALVHVENGDVENVELTVVRDLELRGRLVVENDALNLASNAKDIKLELRPVDVLGNGAPVGFAALSADGRFVYRRLIPIERRLTVSALPVGFYVKEARFGDVDALTKSLFLTTQPLNELEIVLAKGAEVIGRVVDSAGNPVTNQQVALIPNQRLTRPDLYKTGITDSAGRFRIQGVAPGDYRIFAWRALEDYQYFDESFVRRHEESGTPLRVSGTTEMSADVSLIP